MKKKILLISLLWFLSNYTLAGVDLTGKVTRVWLKGDGKLWFAMDNARFGDYCKTQWFGFNLYIPTSDKDFPYYYGLITSANAKGQQIRISNISAFDRTSACDVTQTGYGIVVHSAP